MNKHLIKIINEYLIDYLTFKNELLMKTVPLLDKYNDNWYYYNDYAVCNQEYTFLNIRINFGKIFNMKYKMCKYGSRWTHSIKEI